MNDCKRTSTSGGHPRHGGAWFFAGNALLRGGSGQVRPLRVVWAVPGALRRQMVQTCPLSHARRSRRSLQFNSIGSKPGGARPILIINDRGSDGPDDEDKPVEALG